MPIRIKRDCKYPKLALCAAIGCAALMLSGCGESGPPRYEVSGTVVVDGRPVPVGYIVFTPDAAAGNSGPGGQADIRDGKYNTQLGRGTIGGPHAASIFGFDGKPYVTSRTAEGAITNPMGHPLFPYYTVKLDLPKKASTFDFTIPKTTLTPEPKAKL
jgi:hypothetical protein